MSAGAVSVNLQAGEHMGPMVTIEQDFREFDDANPRVYEALVYYARLWVERRGVKHLGIATLYEVVRWNLAMDTETDDPFKLNNNHRALYARKIMKHEPDLERLFHTRKGTPFCKCSSCV